MKSPRMLLMPAGLAMLYGWLLPQMSVLMGNQNPGMKLLFCILASAPAGFLMGIPFPLGMSLLGSKAPHLIPWAWAVNGCFSVLAPILAAMLALSLGFRVVLLCGSLMYAAAFLLIRTGWDDREERLKTIA